LGYDQQFCTVSSVSLLIFGTAEGAITIMAASIPILRALLQHMRQRSSRPRTVVNHDAGQWGSAVELEEAPEDLKQREAAIGQAS